MESGTQLGQRVVERIWKFGLEDVSEQTFSMPLGSRVLCVQVQHGVPFIWAEVKPWERSSSHVFRTYGTGHDLQEKRGEYVGTYQLHDGGIVFHVFHEQIESGHPSVEADRRIGDA